MGAMDIALEALLFEQEQALQGCTTRSDAVQLSQLLSDDFFEFGASGNVWGSKAEIMTGLLLVG